MGKHHPQNNNSFKHKASIDSFSKNTYVVGGIVLLTFLNLWAYFMANKNKAILVFAFIGLLISFFSKNTAAILIISLVLTNILLSNKNVREGLDNQNEEKKREGFGELPIPPGCERGDRCDPNVYGSDGPGGEEGEGEEEKEKGGKEEKKGKGKGKEGLRVSPSVAQSSIKNAVDKYSTTEEAYENLESMIGAGGLQSLSSETKSIMESQKSMIENMKSMQPLIKQAQGLLTAMNGTKSTQ